MEIKMIKIRYAITVNILSLLIVTGYFNNLLDNEEAKRNFANNAFEFINNNFSWDVLLEKYTNLYES